ncbi:DMT family transporter [Hyphomonas sp.]|jgi:drug/metabolite transporter (DMT)-like permease|uniref:DMT family transporter n=1 Tax=Hyphomonas sp. TaxID=87 RepID=UPI0025B800E0|nr:DMT family transporter [Hyphomonas sp.]MBI1399772.1 EamA family transporter [Hyphomonas sp.]
MPASLLPVALCLASALTVAITNVMVKRGGDVLTTRAIVALVMAATVVPFAPFVPLPPPGTWGLIGLSMVVHWVYQLCAIRALHRGALSLVFPVMRGLGPMATAAFAALFLHEHLSLLQLAGLIAASLSILVFALPTAATHDARRLDRAAMIWAMMTAVGVGLYAVADTRAARAMETPFTFIVWLFLIDWIGVTAVLVWQRRGRVIASMKPELRNGIIGGVAGSISYGLAIYAYTLTDAAAVTALRETSVVFAAALGAWLLKEGFGRRRVVAAATLAAGLVLMQAAG